jgi:hypothetical protein
MWLSTESVPIEAQDSTHNTSTIMMVAATSTMVAIPHKVKHNRMGLDSAASLVIGDLRTLKNTLRISVKLATKKIRSSSVEAGRHTNRATTDRVWSHCVYV